jgi:sterol desaturase/sphingolipid hydroxylase (fatty acid hydroxylase superfamily)
MAKYISNKNETVPLFKNPFLEYFSHIHPITPVIVYTPVIIISAYFGIDRAGILPAITGFICGIFLWTITEYTIHRWAFHYEPKSDLGKHMHFLVHGIHHAYPRDATRLVMPLLVSVPLAVLFYFLFSYIFGIYYLAVFSGFVFGYLSYDSIHYATHHFTMKGRIGNFLRVYHLRHHYEDDKTAFGVSNPLWDYVFRTIPKYLKTDAKISEIEKTEKVTL